MALRAGTRQKGPGIDGMVLEFYTANWDAIKSGLQELLNQMFLHNKIATQQKHAIVLCLPKSIYPTPDGYRPISLLTTEYKLLARIMARVVPPKIN
jgi:hypothetical protein